MGPYSMATAAYHQQDQPFVPPKYAGHPPPPEYGVDYAAPPIVGPTGEKKATTTEPEGLERVSLSDEPRR